LSAGQEIFNLSETLSLNATNVLEVEYQDNASRNSVGENIDGDTLTPLIEANANVLVRCPWLDDEVVALSSAVLAYSEKITLITQENINLVASVMRDLLADSVIEPEDLQELEQPVEEVNQISITVEEDGKYNTLVHAEEIKQTDNTEIEAQGIQNDLNNNDDQKQPKVEAAVAILVEAVTNESGRPSKSENQTAAEAEPAKILNTVKEKSEGSAQDAAEVEASDVSSRGTPYVAQDMAPKKSEVSIKTAAGTVISAKEVNIEASGISVERLKTQKEVHINHTTMADKPRVEIKKQTPVFKVSETPTITNTNAEVDNVPDGSMLTGVQDVQPDTLLVALEETTESELSEPLKLDREEDVILVDTAVEQRGGITLVGVDEAALVEIDYQLDADNPGSFFEDEVPFEHFNETDFVPNEQLLVPDEFSVEDIAGGVEQGAASELLISMTLEEPNITGQIEPPSAELPAWISLKTEKIEKVIIQLVEYIDDGDQEEAEVVNEILDKIIELPTRAETQNGEDIITEIEVEEELSELLSELLDKMDIDYTPELIESLIRLTIRRRITKVIKTLNVDEAPHDTRRHEVISQLLLGISTIKKTMEHASAIGRSALLLSNT
jgi:hypothetical protein